MILPGHILDGTVNSNVAVISRVNHTFPQGVHVNSGSIQGQSDVNDFLGPDFLGLNGFGTGKPTIQTVPLTNQSGTSSISGPQQLMVRQTLVQQNRERALLLEEQPLLLQDLLDPERQEQQQQRQMQAMIRQWSESFFPNIGRNSLGFQ